MAELWCVGSKGAEELMVLLLSIQEIRIFVFVLIAYGMWAAGEPKVISLLMVGPIFGTVQGVMTSENIA